MNETFHEESETILVVKWLVLLPGTEFGSHRRVCSLTDASTFPWVGSLNETNGDVANCTRDTIQPCEQG